MAATTTSQAGRINRQAHISVQRYFEIALLLMLGAGFFTLASTGKLDGISVSLFSAALGVKLWSYARGESGLRLQPRAVARLALAYLLFLPLDFTLLARGAGAAQRILSAAIHLILFVTVVKIFSARRYRDYGYLAVLSFLMMLAAAVLTVKLQYLAGLAIYVFLAIAMFISYEVKRGIETSEAPPRGPYASPARNRVALEISLMLATVAVAAGVAALGAIFFFAIPRTHSTYFRSLAFNAQKVTGFSENIDLANAGQIATSRAVVMRVRIHGSRRAFDGVKWRGIALDTFTGRGWRGLSAARKVIMPAAPGRFLLPDAAVPGGGPRRVLRYQVLLSGLNTDIIFTAASPRELDGRLAPLSADASASLHSPRGGGPIIYNVSSSPGSPSAAMLRRSADHYPLDIRRADLQLPHLDPRIPALARSIASAAANNYDRALAIQNYLRRDFIYTLAPPPAQPADPLGSFLFQTKKGYCVYFASAMAVMLRTLGVPARVVNGFQTGEFNRIGNDFIVRARDAHSWVEVYFPDYGWAPFDPTPDGDRSAAGWSRLGDYLDAASLFWNEWVVNYDFSHQALLARRENQALRRLRASAARWLAAIGRKSSEAVKRARRAAAAHLPLALAFLAAAGASALIRRLWPADLRLRARLQFRSLRPAAPSDATLCYRRFLHAMRAQGFQKRAGQTPQEFAMSLRDVTLQAPALEFTDLYNSLRFGGEAVNPLKLWRLLKTVKRRRPA